MVKLQYNILKTLNDSYDRIEYIDLLNSIRSKYGYDVNQIYHAIVYLQKINYISSTTNIEKEHKGFICISPEGVMVLLAYLESEEQRKFTEKLSKRSLIISFISTIAVLIQSIIVLAQFIISH